VKRGYTLNGLLARDSLIFGFYSNPSVDAERRGQNYTYDRNGRRSTMTWELGTTSYGYSAGGVVDFGPLQQVTDPSGNTYRLRHDLQSRVDSLVVATSGGTVGVRERRGYDADSRLVRRVRESTNGSVGTLNRDSLWYTPRNTVDSAQSDGRAQTSERVRYAYDPLGAVVAQERVRSSNTAYQVQEFRNDAYGNVFYSRTRSSASGEEAPAVSDYFNDGLLISRQTILPPQGQITQNMVSEELSQQGDGGRVTRTGVLVTIPPVNGGGYASQTGAQYYYQADEKLSVVQRYDFRVGSSANLGSWEEYWYDALGRRVLTRARRSGSPPTGAGALCNDPVGNTCQSYWQRTVWDGDQLLYEWRTADGSSTDLNSGYAGYVHLEGLDQPVGLMRSDGTRVLNYNWRGLGESSVFTNGAPGDVSIFGGTVAVDWPTRTQGGVYFTPNVLASGPSGPFTWFGTLAENGAGSTGLLYKRNRYFDPVSGRFTQADPIGLGGGLNLYGFADGDPVNFSDPFGLKPCPPTCGLEDAGDLAAGMTPGLSSVVDALTAFSGKNPITGESVGVSGRLIAFAGLITPAGGGEIRAGGKAVSITRHYLDRKMERAVRSADVWDALKNPISVKEVKLDGIGRPSQQIVGKRATVVQNPESGSLVNVWPTSSIRARSLEKR
jgi:RHS repeat-associated protein